MRIEEGKEYTVKPGEGINELHFKVVKVHRERNKCWLKVTDPFDYETEFELDSVENNGHIVERERAKAATASSESSDDVDSLLDTVADVAVSSLIDIAVESLFDSSESSGAGSTDSDSFGGGGDFSGGGAGGDWS